MTSAVHAEHTVTSVWETAPFSSGLPSNPACGFLGFTPQCEIINLITSLERLLKNYTSKGVCIYTGLLKLPCGKKRGQNEKEQMRCSASYKVQPWSRRKWAERLLLSFPRSILMSTLGSVNAGLASAVGQTFMEEPDNLVKDWAQAAQSIPPLNDHFILLMRQTISNSHGEFTDIHRFTPHTQTFIFQEPMRV